MTIDEILSHFQGVKKIASGWQCLCPSHEDKNASLSISEGKDGKILLHCHAGCANEAIIAAANLKIQDLFPPKDEKPQFVEAYDYVTADGKLIYQVCRYTPKTFKQRRPNPADPTKWLWSMVGVERILYCLPEVINGIKSNATIFVMEGEKDTNTFKKLGLCATCNSGGAGKWQDNYTETLTGAKVIIIAHKDEAGRKYSQLVAESIHGKATRIHIIELPDRDGHKVNDAADWIAAGGVREELFDIFKKTKEWKPTELPKPEAFYYDKNQKEYLLKNRRKCWLSLSETQFKKELAHRGMRPHKEKGENVSEADEFIIQLRDDRDVDYVGSLAGYASGFYEIDGRRVLVTDSPTIIKPSPGTWENIDAIMSGLLLDEKYNQRDYLFAWLKIAYESLQKKQLRPGQALALCGPHNCGKSLLQLLITRILGGRSAKPYDFMVDSTSFNSEMFKAEHLCIEDESASTDIRARRAFGAQIKQIAACYTQRCHKKNCEAITLTPFWRLTISINDEPENLMVLPPIDDSIEDKIIILRASGFTMPMPSETNEEQQALWKQLVSELPSFIDYLCNWKIPDSVRGQRYGVTHFHHPELLVTIDSMSPEYRLLTMIDTVLFDSPMSSAWTGEADALQRMIMADETYGRESARLLSWSNATGTYLGRLAKKYPDRVSYARGHRSRIWRLSPPIVEEQQ